MSDFQILDELILEKAISFWLKEVTLFFQDEILKITPRDLLRLPESIDRKDWQKPYRSTPYKPVFINWHWYVWVTWNLKKSIVHEELDELYFMIWVAKWPATKYARAQEYWWVHNPPRSFIRKWIFDNISEAKRVFEKAVAYYFKTF